MNEVKELLGLSNKNIKVIGIDVENNKDKLVKVVTVIGIAKKEKFAICNKYTSSIYGTMKTVNSKYVKVA